MYSFQPLLTYIMFIKIKKKLYYILYKNILPFRFSE